MCKESLLGEKDYNSQNPSGKGNFPESLAVPDMRFVDCGSRLGCQCAFLQGSPASLAARSLAGGKGPGHCPSALVWACAWTGLGYQCPLILGNCQALLLYFQALLCISILHNRLPTQGYSTQLWDLTHCLFTQHAAFVRLRIQILETGIMGVQPHPSEPHA